MKSKKILISGCLAISILFTSCFGSFKLTRAVYDWNMEIDTDIGKECVFLILGGIQVYSLLLFIDVVFLNTIEYWTGSNPMSMKPGEEDTKLVCYKGETFTVTARHHEFEITNCSNETVNLKYEEEDDNWYVINDGKKVKYPKRRISRMLRKA